MEEQELPVGLDGDKVLIPVAATDEQKQAVLEAIFDGTLVLPGRDAFLISIEERFADTEVTFVETGATQTHSGIEFAEIIAVPAHYDA